MKRVLFILLLGCPVFASIPFNYSPVGEKPNVILLVADRLGVEEAKSLLPDLHARSFRFAQGYRSSLVESQTAFGILTGQYPTAIGPHQLLRTPAARSEKTPVLQAVTLPDLFLRGGYQTAHFGLWNFGTSKSERLPLDFGIQHHLLLQNPQARGTSHATRNADKISAGALAFVREQRKQAFYLEIYLPSKNPLERERLKKLTENLLESLRELGISEKTVFAFTALAPTATAAPLSEANLKVPLWIQWPRNLAAKEDTQTLVSHIDLLPTLGALARIPIPSPLLFDGEDVSFVGNGKTLERVDPLFWELSDSHGRRGAAMRNEKWKLLWIEPSTRLYSLDQDPSEQQDLSTQKPTERERLRQKLLHWMNRLVSPEMNQKLG